MNMRVIPYEMTMDVSAREIGMRVVDRQEQHQRDHGNNHSEDDQAFVLSEHVHPRRSARARSLRRNQDADGRR